MDLEETLPIRNEGGEAAAAERIEGSECRSEAEECEMISSSTGSDKLSALVEGEATVKRKKRRRKVDADVEENKMIESVQTMNCRAEPNGDKAGSTEVTDICSSSSMDDDSLISNISFGTSIGDMVSAEGTINVHGETVSAEETVDAGMKGMHAEKAKCVETVKSPYKSAKNTVLRNHHKPRYFDPPNSNWARWPSRGDNHPAAANCTLQKLVKACFLRRNRQYGKHCSQGQYCFVCRGTFHQANDCPKKQEDYLNHIVCLRCGDSGHDMFSCRTDYSADDLKKIRCYICNDFGHLSCVKLPDTIPTEVSCYSCGQSGHLGSDCSKCPKVARGSKSPVLCYRCREEGHFARTCTLPRKHARKVNAEMRAMGSSSAPPNRGPQNGACDAKGETQESLIRSFNNDGVIIELSLTTSEDNQGRIHNDSCKEQPLSVIISSLGSEDQLPLKD